MVKVGLDTSASGPVSYTHLPSPGKEIVPVPKIVTSSLCIVVVAAREALPDGALFIAQLQKVDVYKRQISVSV